MSSRQEEKERRRREREEAERAAARAGDRRKRVGVVLGAALALAVGVIVVLAATTGGDEGANQTPGGDIAIPPFEITNAAEAARAANCELEEFEIEGRGHTGETVQYQTSPPTSGDHDPVPADDGIYPVGSPPDLEQSVHSLEHGRINIQYKPGTPANVVNQLEALVDGFEVKGEAGYHALLFANQTNMEPQVAASAWGTSLSCPTMNDQVFDALRAFWRTNVDRGPEFIP